MNGGNESGNYDRNRGGNLIADSKDGSNEGMLFQNDAYPLF